MQGSYCAFFGKLYDVAFHNFHGTLCFCYLSVSRVFVCLTRLRTLLRSLTFSSTLCCTLFFWHLSVVRTKNGVCSTLQAMPSTFVTFTESRLGSGGQARWNTESVQLKIRFELRLYLSLIVDRAASSVTWHVHGCLSVCLIAISGRHWIRFAESMCRSIHVLYDVWSCYSVCPTSDR